MTTAAAILAHQGGWDEILMVAGPLLVIAGLLWVAKRRVDRAAADQPGKSPARPPAKARQPKPR